MKIIADDGREFQTVEEAQAYEKDKLCTLKKQIEAKTAELNQMFEELESFGYEIQMSEQDGVLVIGAQKAKEDEKDTLLRMMEEMFR